MMTAVDMAGMDSPTADSRLATPSTPPRSHPYASPIPLSPSAFPPCVPSSPPHPASSVHLDALLVADAALRDEFRMQHERARWFEGWIGFELVGEGWMRMQQELGPLWVLVRVRVRVLVRVRLRVLVWVRVLLLVLVV